MTGRDTLERMVDGRDESTELRSLLDAGIADDVADYDFAHGLETHLAAVGTGPGGGAPGAPAGAGPGASSAAGATSAKALALAIGVPVVSAIAAFVVFASHGPAPTASTVAAKAPIASVEMAVPPEGARAGETPSSATVANAGEGPGIAPSDKTSRSALRAATEAQRHPVAHSSKLTLAEDTPAGSPPISAPGASEDHPSIHRNFPEGPVQAHGSNVATPAESATATVIAPEEPRPSEEAVARAERAREEARRDAEDKLQREMEELMRAKRALSSDPKLALDLAERGQREFKQSLLSEEREHVLLLALIGVGRVTEAERRAAPYLAKHPDSPFARRVRAALEARKTR